MKILDKRILTVGDYEYPQIMINKDIWEYCDGRPCFVINDENLAQRFLDRLIKFGAKLSTDVDEIYTSDVAKDIIYHVLKDPVYVQVDKHLLDEYQVSSATCIKTLTGEMK